MLIQVKNYYSQRFEPGVLFPEVITTTLNGAFTPDSTFRALYTPQVELDATIQGVNIDLQTYDVVDSDFDQSANPFYGFVGLYYFGAPEDFNLDEMVGFSSNIKSFEQVESDLNAEPETFVDGKQLDSRLLLAGYGEDSIQTSVTRDIFLSQGIKDFEVYLTPIDAVLMNSTNFNFNFTIG